MSTDNTGLNLFSFTGKIRILHLSWFAFFLTFVVWFSHAPLMASIRESMGLTDQQIKMLLILNVALTIPARIVIGMLVDKFGPRLVFSLLLFCSSFLCFFFAFAQSFETLALARFLLGFVGAGFVIGIRMIGEWFPARQVGLAEGIYGGWGNFGSAAAAMSLPTIAMWYGGADGWRYAIATTGVLILLYAFVYYFSVSNTPRGSTYFKPKKIGAMEVTSKGDFILYLIMSMPLYIALAVLAWKLNLLGMLTADSVILAYASLVGLYLYQVYHIYKVNKDIFANPVPEIHRYKFKQVAILNLSYLVTFGSELAVVSMLPLFFLDTFDISPIQAGMLASGYAFMNLAARPAGGWMSDKIGRKRSLLVFIGGLSVGYFVLSQINAEWPIALAVVATMCCSFFVQSGEGAVFAIVPLVKRRMTGQIAGMTGAYGNVGAVAFLTVLSFVTPQVFFMTIGVCAVVILGIVSFMDEPEGHTAEVMPDGTVQLIEVS